MRSDWIRCSAFVQMFPWAGGFVFLRGRRAAWLLLNSAYYTGHRVVGQQFQVFLVCLCPLVCCVPFCSGSRRPCEEWQTIVPTRGSSGLVEYMLLRGPFPQLCSQWEDQEQHDSLEFFVLCVFVFLLGVDISLKLTSHPRFWTPFFLLWLQFADICEQSVSKALGERLWLTACLQTGCLKRSKGDSGKGLVKFKTCDSVSKNLMQYLLEADKFLGSHFPALPQ